MGRHGWLLAVAALAALILGCAPTTPPEMRPPYADPMAPLPDGAVLHKGTVYTLAQGGMDVLDAATRKPLAGVVAETLETTLTPEGTHERILATTTSDAQGKVRFYMNDYSPLGDAIRLRAPGKGTFAVRPLSSHRVVALGAPSAVKGRTSPPVAGAVVELYAFETLPQMMEGPPRPDPPVLSTRTSAAGTFELEGVSLEDPLLLVLRAEGHPPASCMVPARNTQELELSLAPSAGTISGIVWEDDTMNRGIPGAPVFIGEAGWTSKKKQDFRYVAIAFTDENGFFTTRAVPREGKYKVATADNRSSGEVTLDRRGDEAALDLISRATSWQSGTAEVLVLDDSTGLPVPGVTVHADGMADSPRLAELGHASIPIRWNTMGRKRAAFRAVPHAAQQDSAGYRYQPARVAVDLPVNGGAVPATLRMGKAVARRGQIATEGSASRRRWTIVTPEGRRWSGEDGGFEFFQVPGRELVLEVIAQENLRIPVPDIEGPEAASEPFVIPVRLAGTVSGTVVGEDGKPVPGVRIEAKPRGPIRDRPTEKPAEGSGLTLADGTYTITFTQANEYELTAWPLDALVAGTIPPAGPVTVEVGDGRNLDRVDFALKRGVSLEGTVTDQDGNPLPGARVVFEQGDRTLIETLARADGTFSLQPFQEGVLPGRVVVSHPAHETWRSDSWDMEPGTKRPRPLSVPAAPIRVVLLPSGYH